LDALDVNYNDRYFDGNDSSASIASSGLRDDFSNARTSSPVINYNDPDAVIKAFDKAFAETGCAISTEFKPNSGYGGYQAFLTFPKDGGATYLNTMFLNPDRDAHSNRVSEIHEAFHAIQFDKVPELHASPYNMLAYQEVPVILSPRSWVLAMLLIEREAYAKTAWINKLELDKNLCADYAEAAGREIVNQSDIAHWHDRYPDDIGFALGEASLVWDNKIKAKQKIALSVPDALCAPDIAEFSYICVEGLPDGGILSKGEKLEDGRWIVAKKDIDGLKIGPPSKCPSIDLVITAHDNKGDVQSQHVLPTIIVTEPDVELKDHYIDFAIRLYEKSYRLNTSPTAEKPVFIDLDDQGILALGASFGPSIFGKFYPDPIFKDLKLTPEQEERVRALEEKFGIEPEQKLPTLRQELAKRDISVDEYMHRSKTFIDRPPVLEEKQEFSMAL
jgi:hypothetical protein